MKNRCIKLLTFVILFLMVGIVRVNAVLDKSHNDAFYNLNVDLVSSDCSYSSSISNNRETEDRLYTLQCLHCSGNKVTYDGCGSYYTTHFDTGWGHFSLGDYHEECKRPVVYYRTQKGAKTDDYPRCDTIVDEAKTECTKIYGNACETCDKDYCCEFKDESYPCGCDENGTNCSSCTRQVCAKWCPQTKCNGYDANGGVAVSGCAAGTCSECYEMGQGWIAALESGDDWAAPANYSVVVWSAVYISDAVNASCDTQNKISWDTDHCNSAAVKISDNVCQKQYKIKPKGTTTALDAYCVNPDLKTSTGIQLDDSFDVSICETSRSTRYCGFANILIEGNLRKAAGKYSGMDWYSVISYALQLWGGHVGEGGYTGSGFSPESSLASESQNSVLSFPPLPDRTSSGNIGFGIVMETTDYRIDYHERADYYRNYLEFVDVNGHDTGFYRNIFQQTGDNIHEYLTVTDEYHVTSNADVKLIGSGNNKNLDITVHESGLRAVGCDTLKNKNLVGFCGIDKKEYLEALYLYVNTVQGNKLMQEHLNDLIWLNDPNIDIDDLGKSNNPESISTSIDTDTERLTITYKMADQGKNMKCASNSTRNGVKVCCKAGDPECNFSQNKITIEQSDGSRFEINNPPKRYDYCMSGYCYLTVDLSGRINKDTICQGVSHAIFDIKLAVLNTKSAIKRYEAKDSPSDHQSYFLIDYSHDNNPGNSDGGYRTEIACDGCKDGASIETGYVIDPALVSNPEAACLQNEAARFDRETKLCYVRLASDDNRKKTSSIGNKCINCVVDSHGQCITNNGVTMVDDSINARKISDPSLNCIVNMSYTTANNGKQYYDYSEEFGVNPDVCRIYCSDEVNIYLANKRDVYVGMQLQYNIESIVENAYAGTSTNRKTIFDANHNGRYYGEGGRNNGSNESLMLSAIVLQERKCVSKIYFNRNHYDTSIDWMTKYKIGGNINNWKDLYNAMRTKSGSEHDRRENLNQLIYDLYNCNLLTPTEISTKSHGAVSKPVDRENVYDEMIKLYKTKTAESETITAKTSNAHIADHRCADVSQPCSDLRWASYNGGAQYLPNHLINNHKRVGTTIGEPEISYYTTSNADLTGVEGNKPISVFYCNRGECFKGENNYLDDFYETANNNPNYQTLRSQVGTNFNGAEVEIPTKDFAVFTIQIRTDYYNSIEYQVEHYTGKVKKYTEADNSKYVKLDKFVYPVSLDAYQDGTCHEPDEFNKDQQGRCITKFAFNIKPIIWRKNSMDKFTQYLRQEDPNGATEYICSYVSQPAPIRNGIVYRSIKLKDPFPNDNNETRPTPTNWMTDLGKKTIREIKESADEINIVTDKYLEYKYTLTKQALDNIRDNYNYSKDIAGVGYADVESLQNCKKAYPDTYEYKIDYHSEENGTIYVECESTFLDYLVGLQGVTVHKGDGISKCTMDPGCR